MPTHEQVMRVAEELSDQLAQDREELINFVYESLTRCYEEDPDSFLEDWHEYVKGPVFRISVRKANNGSSDGE